VTLGRRFVELEVYAFFSRIFRHFVER
jgi:hypothetical protein